MTKSEFEFFINKLLVYFGKEKFFLSENTKRERLRVWYERVSSIPAEPLPWIQDQLQDNFDGLPTNIPKEVRHLWEVWLEANPGKRAYTNKACENCPYCQDGLMVLKIKPENYPYVIEKVCRCGHCQSDNRQAIPMKTK